MIDTITINQPISVDGYEMARALRDVLNDKVAKSWLESFLAHMNDRDYETVCKFVEDNPHWDPKKDSNPPQEPQP